MGVVVGRVGDWPENEAGEGRVGAGLGGCPSRGWSITEQNGRGIEAQKERWLKARLEFPSILSGGKFSCSLVHDFRANEYRGQGIGCKGIRPLHGQRMLVGLSRRGCASVILPRMRPRVMRHDLKGWEEKLRRDRPDSELLIIN